MRISSLQRNRFLLIVILTYVMFGILILINQYNYITNYQYSTLGENALNLAGIAVKTIEITKEDVEELENLTFEELQSHPINVKLENMVKLVEEHESIKYAYILRAVPEDKVKYAVDETDTEFYALPIGTKLDYMWLLDVVVDINLQNEIKENGVGYYKDKNRYTAVSGSLLDAVKMEKATYLQSEGEWGTQISGLAPIYTVDGEYVGVFGIDVLPNTFYSYRSTIFWSLTALFMIPTIFMSGLYLYLHFKYKKSIAYLAYNDQLTGAYNRRYFDAESSKVIRSAAKNANPVGVIIGDIDDFKIYNDKYGHQEGDVALQIVTDIMNSCLDKESGFVARYGGEEFVIVLNNPEKIEELCNNICKALSYEKIKLLNGMITRVTISLGGYVKIPQANESIDVFVKKADEAMYEAKRSGKNTFIIDRYEENK